MSTVNDLKQKLKEAGLDSGGWTENPGGPRTSPLLARQGELLKQLESLIKLQIEKDRAQMSDLHLKLSKLKHGGGA
jgi:hypothetical protein